MVPVIAILLGIATGWVLGEFIGVLWVLGFFFLRVFYFTFFEMTPRAATPGKRIVALMPVEGEGVQQTQSHVNFLENLSDELRRKVLTPGPKTPGFRWLFLPFRLA